MHTFKKNGLHTTTNSDNVENNSELANGRGVRQPAWAGESIWYERIARARTDAQTALMRRPQLRRAAGTWAAG